MSCPHLDEGAEPCLCNECAAMVTVVLAAYESDKRKLLAWVKEAKSKLLAGGTVSLRRFCSYCASDDFATDEEQRAHAATCDKHPAVARAAAAEAERDQARARIDLLKGVTAKSAASLRRLAGSARRFDEHEPCAEAMAGVADVLERAAVS